LRGGCSMKPCGYRIQTIFIDENDEEIGRG
jgi:hypothetical protein